MLIEGYLVIDAGGSLRVTKNPPNLAWSEIAIHLEIDFPGEIFRKPKFKAKITIPDSAALPEEISAETIENVQDAITRATGLKVVFELIPEEANKDEKSSPPLE